MGKIKIAIVGSTGAVGEQLTSLLQSSSSTFPHELSLFNSSSSSLFLDQLSLFDLAFFCVSSSLAQDMIPKALAAGLICIDSSSAYRTNPEIPLVIPEINGDLLLSNPKLIASPNCTATMMLLALSPLHTHFQVKRVIAVTYQAVSGAGAKGMQELLTQSKESLEGKPLSLSVFPFPCAFNIFPHESPLYPSGYVEEECKMQEESQKILNDSQIKITAMCTRVPLLRSHGIALNIECLTPFSLEEAKAILEAAPGLQVVKTPTAHLATEKEKVLCGRIRLDRTNPNTLECFVVGDQLLKGAALNMFQIARKLYDPASLLL